jgi:hypothetical protein
VNVKFVEFATIKKTTILGTFDFVVDGSDIVVNFVAVNPNTDLIFSAMFISSTYSSGTNAYDGTAVQISSNEILTSNGDNILDTFDILSYSNTSYRVFLTDGNDNFSCGIKVVHDGVDSQIVQYSNLGTNFGLFSAQLINGAVQLTLTTGSTTVSGVLIKTRMKI